MPLGQTEGNGNQRNDSRYCGVEIEFDNDIPRTLSFSLSTGFDFILAPLVDPKYRPPPFSTDFIPPFAASDLVLTPAQWGSHVVAKISSWIDLDSTDEQLRLISEQTLNREISWACHISLQV